MLDHKIFKKAPDWKNCPGIPRVYCPVCKDDMYEDGTRVHIANTAKHEIFRKHLEKLDKGKKLKTPHFDFWYESTSILRGKRAWRI